MKRCEKTIVDILINGEQHLGLCVYYSVTQ